MASPRPDAVSRFQYDMAKKVKFESFVYRFLSQAHAMGRVMPADQQKRWSGFVNGLEFHYEKGTAVVVAESARRRAFSLHELLLFQRGDAPVDAVNNAAFTPVDAVESSNAEFFREAVTAVADDAGFHVDSPRVRDFLSKAARSG